MLTEARKSGGILGPIKARTLSRLPRYQNLPSEVLKTGALKVGIGKKLTDMKNPLKTLGDDLNGYLKRHKDLLDDYNAFKLSFNQIRIHGAKYSKSLFMMKSFFKSLKNGEITDYIARYGDYVEEIKKLQSELITEYIENVDQLRVKLNQANGDADYFIRNLSDDDLSVMERISKDGALKELKPVFKQYKIVTQSLRPSSYIYGHRGEPFAQKIYSSGENQFRSPEEDIVLFYESLLDKYGFNNPSTQSFREQIERSISDLYRVENGQRVYRPL
jgi:hypothetical protein